MDRTDTFESTEEHGIYFDDYELDGVGSVGELHAQHEGGRHVVVRSLEDSPETTVLRYSIWNIM